MMTIASRPIANSPGCSARARCEYPSSLRRASSCVGVNVCPRLTSYGRPKIRGSERWVSPASLASIIREKLR
jgi:hypothetical protein